MMTIDEPELLPGITRRSISMYRLRVLASVITLFGFVVGPRLACAQPPAESKHRDTEERPTKSPQQPSQGTKAAKPAKPIDPIALALLAAHNRERKKEKHDALALSPELCEAATIQAKDMAAHHKLDHTGSDDSTVSDRVKRVGYVYVRVGENIAFGQNGVEEVTATWLDSPPHHENMMADFTEMGAARVDDDETVPYWCVVFGLPMPRLKPNEAVAAVLKEWNRKRKDQKKSSLKAEPNLGRAAMATSKAMADKESSKIEGDPFKQIGKAGSQDRELRLTASVNVPTAAEAAKSLIEDNADELARFTDVGIGYAISKSGKPYWCAIFSRTIPSTSRSARLRENEDRKDEP
jgi:uncharacterized protein YkwD